jgi:hypothetical protein
MSHFTEALYLRKTLQRLISENNILKSKLQYLFEAAAPPPQPKGGLSPAETVVGHVFTPPSTLVSQTGAGSPEQIQRWIDLVFNRFVNLQELCSGASNCIWNNPNLQNAFAEALLEWLQQNNINEAQMLYHLDLWQRYSAMLNHLNDPNLPPGQAFEFFTNNTEWQQMFAQMNNPAFQNTLTGYLNNLNQFFDLLNRFRNDLASGGPLSPDDLFYEFHMAANVTAVGQLDNYIKQLEAQIEKFRRYAQEALPSGSNARSLSTFYRRFGNLMDRMANAANVNFTPSELYRYIRAIIDGDEATMRQILESSPWVQQMQQQLGSLNSQQLQDLANQLRGAQTSTDMYIALSAVLGVVVAGYLIAYLYQYLFQSTQQSGGYSPNP